MPFSHPFHSSHHEVDYILPFFLGEVAVSLLMLGQDITPDEVMVNKIPVADSQSFRYTVKADGYR